MSVSEIDDEQISHLPIPTADTHLTMLLGAGASAASGLPSWDKMVENLICNTGILKVKDSEKREVAQSLVAHGDLTLLAEGLKKEDQKKWMSRLRDALYGPEAERAKNDLQPSSMQLNAAELACVHPDCIHLATLNFDHLLETAIETVRKEMLVSRTTIPVEHLHGSITMDDAPAASEAPVFAFSDYLDNIKNPDASARRYLARTLEQGSLLIAGTTFRDPDMRQWLVDLLRNHKKENDRRSCIIIAREGLGVTHALFEKMKPALEAEWRALGLTPIFVNDHNDAAQLIKEIQYCMTPDASKYLTPASRAEELWKRLTRPSVFKKTYQPQFAELLQHQKETLKKILPGRQTMNATLWISHGNKLTRYATHDRLYRSSRLLREDVVGYDSPLLAGEALGRNTIAHTHPEGDGRWKTILAAPITVFPGKDAPHYSPLPLAVVTFGLERAIDSDKVKALLYPELARMVDAWTDKLNEIVVETS